MAQPTDITNKSYRTSLNNGDDSSLSMNAKDIIKQKCAASLQSNINRLKTGREISRDNTAKLGDFLPDQYQKEISNPSLKTAQFVDLWEDYIGGDLAAVTAIESFSRGILVIRVDSAATKYRINKRLASGVEKAIKTSIKGSNPIKRISLVIDPSIVR